MAQATDVDLLKCDTCGAHTKRLPHMARACIDRLSRRLKESERERKIADETVAWLRKRLGECGGE